MDPWRPVTATGKHLGDPIETILFGDSPEVGESNGGEAVGPRMNGQPRPCCWRAVAHHRDPFRTHAAATARDLGVRLVRREDMSRDGERQPLGNPCKRTKWPFTELHGDKLGTEVVVIEYDLTARDPKQGSREEEDVWRVVEMENSATTDQCPERGRVQREPSDQVLKQYSDRSVTRLQRPVSADVHAVYLLVSGLVVPTGSYHLHGVPGEDKRLRLPAHARILRVGLFSSSIVIRSRGRAPPLDVAVTSAPCR